MRTTLFVAFSALALASSAAWAKEPTLPSDDARTAHAETDENHDGNIDREEFHHRQVDVFYHADTDKDGSLSEAEFAKLDAKTHVAYTADRLEAIRLAREGHHQAAFLIAPTTMDELEAVVRGGAVLPQKSTHFYPKLLDGLVFHRMGD